MNHVRPVRLFLSTVSQEFRSYRDALRKRLSRPNVTVHVQEDFIPTGTETLDKLDLYVRDCDAVVHLVGYRTGAWAGPAALQTLKARYPDLSERLPVLKASLDNGHPPLSYTQWEAYLAVYHRKVLVVATAAPEAPRDVDLPVDPLQDAEQAAHRERLQQLGRYSEITFANQDQLIADVLQSTVLDILAKAQSESLHATNIPVRVPPHFIGREDSLSAIEAALGRFEGRIAVAALHGLRGVGKTALAAAYAEQHRRDYRATWWVRAQTEATMRADLVALGVRLNWVAEDEKEEPALGAVMERLRHEGEGILLIYDNAPDAAAVRKYLPRGGVAHVLVTSNAHSWRGVGEPLEIKLWPKDIGGHYLVARTGRADEGDAAQALSHALDGLPLAHEQAAAYCEDLDIGFAEYLGRFEKAALAIIDDSSSASLDYHPEHGEEHRDRLTVAGTFRLAIEQAAKRHPAAEPLIVHAALLASEPIPLFLFSEAVETFGEPLGSALAGAGDGLDRVLAALRAFALIDREAVVDERNPAITTDCIRLQRLVRHVAAARREGPGRDEVRSNLLAALVKVYPEEQDAFGNPAVWPRARRLDAIVSELVGSAANIVKGGEVRAAELLNNIAEYRYGALAAQSDAIELHQRALALREQSLGADHPDTASSLNNLGRILADQGDFASASALFSRALAINEKALGPDHAETANSLGNLGRSLKAQGDLVSARPLMERALAIREKLYGTQHYAVAANLHSLALLLEQQGDLAGARQFFERTLSIDEKISGPDHPETAVTLGTLASLLLRQGDLAGARPLMDRAFAIREKVFGLEHPATMKSLDALVTVMRDQGDLAGAQRLYERLSAVAPKVSQSAASGGS